MGEGCSENAPLAPFCLESIVCRPAIVSVQYGDRLRRTHGWFAPLALPSAPRKGRGCRRRNLFAKFEGHSESQVSGSGKLRLVVMAPLPDFRAEVGRGLSRNCAFWLLFVWKPSLVVQRSFPFNMETDFVGRMDGLHPSPCPLPLRRGEGVAVENCLPSPLVRSVVIGCHGSSP